MRTSNPEKCVKCDGLRSYKTFPSGGKWVCQPCANASLRAWSRLTRSVKPKRDPKICPKCGGERLFKVYASQSAWICLPCGNASAKEYRKCNQSWRERDRRYKRSPKGRMNDRLRMRKYRSDPIFLAKEAARAAVHRAVESGILIRPGKCQGCQKACKPQGHHYLGYEWERRFDVIWLCIICHRKDESR